MMDSTSITEFPANRACCSKQGLMLMHYYMIRVRNRMKMHNSQFYFVRGMPYLCCSAYLSEETEDVGVASDAIRVLLQVILQHNTSDVHTLYTRTCTSYNSQNTKIAALLCGKKAIHHRSLLFFTFTATPQSTRRPKYFLAKTRFLDFQQTCTYESSFDLDLTMSL